MKKANDRRNKMATATVPGSELLRLAKEQQERIADVGELFDSQIDTADIPEVARLKGWVRVHEHPEHRMHRALSPLLAISLPEQDIELAQRLAEVRGLPYQTYIKSVLHEALERDRVSVDSK